MVSRWKNYLATRPRSGGCHRQVSWGSCLRRWGQLPRQQQEKILDVVSALVAQHAYGKSRVA